MNNCKGCLQRNTSNTSKDYTLAQYRQPAFDKLAFDGAKEKLVYKLGYPEEVLEFEYDHEVSGTILADS
jgi:hypothetical protein